ncbi:hypothetical protein HPP92_008101, partial [Vanilla planifolia]
MLHCDHDLFFYVENFSWKTYVLLYVIYIFFLYLMFIFFLITIQIVRAVPHSSIRKTVSLELAVALASVPMAFAAAHVRLRGFLLLRAHVLKASLPRLYTVAISSLEATQPLEPGASVGEGATWTAAVGGVGGVSHPMAPKKQVRSWEEHPEYRRWKNKEEEILRDIEPIMFLTKDILHSDKYHDGERLCPEDEKEVVEKLLVYHPYSKDKIGCGFDSIM